MYKFFLLTAFGLFFNIAGALELNCTFDRELPSGVSVAGAVQKENGIPVKVNNKNYVAAIIRFAGEENAKGVLELDLMTEFDTFYANDPGYGIAIPARSKIKATIEKNIWYLFDH